jgi:hypothetical protein
MATVLNNVLVLVNGVDLSDHVRTVRHSTSFEEVDTTCVNDTAKTRLKGHTQTLVGLQFLQDFAGAKVHSTLQPLVGSSTPVQVEVRPVNGAVSSANPAMLIQALLMDYTALDAAVGEVSPVSATFISSIPSGGGGVVVPPVGGGIYDSGFYDGPLPASYDG